MHRCILSTVATDSLVLKHQAISTHNADYTYTVLNQFHTEISLLYVGMIIEIILHFEKNTLLFKS